MIFSFETQFHQQETEVLINEQVQTRHTFPYPQSPIRNRRKASTLLDDGAIAYIRDGFQASCRLRHELLHRLSSNRLYLWTPRGKKLFIFKGKSGILYNLVTSCLIWGLVWLSHQKLFPPSVPHLAPSLYKAHITSWSLIQNEQELHKSFLQSYPSTVFIPSYCYRMPLDLKGYTLEKYTKKKDDFLAAEIST